MKVTHLLDIGSREVLHEWLIANHATAREVWVTTNRRKKPRTDAIPYIDVVEEALCFGWIDSTHKPLGDGRSAQRISPRRPGSHWTELNIRRCLSLIEQGMMTEFGLAAMPLTKIGQ